MFKNKFFAIWMSSGSQQYLENVSPLDHVAHNHYGHLKWRSLHARFGSVNKGTCVDDVPIQSKRFSRFQSNLKIYLPRAKKVRAASITGNNEIISATRKMWCARYRKFQLKPGKENILKQHNSYNRKIKTKTGAGFHGWINVMKQLFLCQNFWTYVWNFFAMNTFSSTKIFCFQPFYKNFMKQ